MYERALHFKNRFLRDGVLFLLFTPLFIYMNQTDGKPFTKGIIILPLVGSLWLLSGWWILKNLKLKSASGDGSEIIPERMHYKKAELVFSFLIFITLVLSLQHWKFAEYLGIAVVVSYSYWLYSQIKLLRNYFAA